MSVRCVCHEVSVAASFLLFDVEESGHCSSPQSDILGPASVFSLARHPKLDSGLIIVPQPIGIGLVHKFCSPPADCHLLYQPQTSPRSPLGRGVCEKFYCIHLARQRNFSFFFGEIGDVARCAKFICFRDALTNVHALQDMGHFPGVFE